MKMLLRAQEDVARRFPIRSDDRALSAPCVKLIGYYWLPAQASMECDYAVTHLLRDECDNLEHHPKRISVLLSRILERSGDRFSSCYSAAVTPARHWWLLLCLERTAIESYYF